MTQNAASNIWICLPSAYPRLHVSWPAHWRDSEFGVQRIWQMPRLRRLLLGQRATVLLVLLLRQCGALVIDRRRRAPRVVVRSDWDGGWDDAGEGDAGWDAENDAGGGWDGEDDSAAAPGVAAGWDSWDEPADAAADDADDAGDNRYERALNIFGAALTPEQREVIDVDGALDSLNAERIIGLDGEPLGEDDAGDGKLDLLAEDALESLVEIEAVEDERLGVVASHELIDVDADGDPVTEATKMVFVDEASCIGCTMCATIAQRTFLLEDQHGRARVFNQEGDDDETVAEAISTCPVDCIHYVPWDELVELERQREGVMDSYNFKGRLVGNEGLLSTAGRPRGCLDMSAGRSLASTRASERVSAQAGAGPALLEISTNTQRRCTNCPSNQCPDCPMFAVSQERTRKTRCGKCPENGCANCPIAVKYPEFQKRRARRDRKRKEREKAKQREAASNLGLDDGGGAREL